MLLLPEPRFMYSNRVSWYPQAPVSDYATATMRLTVPSEYQIVGSGTLVGSSLSPVDRRRAATRSSARTVEYSTDRPVRYLACVISRFVPVGTSRVEPRAARPAASPCRRPGSGDAGTRRESRSHLHAAHGRTETTASCRRASRP